MNNEEITKKVRSVIVRVLEDASFVFSDELAPEERPSGVNWDAEGVSLSFSGDRSGFVRLWADRGFGSILAVNMLGIDGGDPQVGEKGGDAFREMVNIIAGNAMTELFGQTAVIELGIPASADAAMRAADCARSDAVWLSAEEMKIVCVVDLK